MTRTEVARYLGKSVATVRRAEGVHLHPRRDHRGVHHFAPAEVRALAQAIRVGEVRLTHIKFHQQAETPTKSSDEHVVQQLRNEFLQLRTLAAVAVDLLFDVAPPRLLGELDPDLLEGLLALGDPGGDGSATSLEEL
jgi:hypothetical protein